MRLTLTTPFTLLAAVTAATQVGYGAERVEDSNQAALAKRMMVLQECSITGCWRDKPDPIQWNHPPRQALKPKKPKKHSSKAKRSYKFNSPEPLVDYLDRPNHSGRRAPRGYSKKPTMKGSHGKRGMAKRLITTQDCPTTGCDGFPPKFSTPWRSPRRKPSKARKHSSKAKRSGQADYQDVDDFAQEGFGGDDEYNQRIGRTLGMIFGRLINRGFVNN
ncbi:hypothetical protein EC988_004043 [Linderina pennispora]|nr:hypothetical protein EC988_004043 [Linderina pennispora]